jgi:hypothetical protein
MLDEIVNHKVYGDVIMEYHCLTHKMVNIFPAISLVRNRGNDGSGMHCHVASGYSTQEICTESKPFCFINDITICADMEKRIIDAMNFPFTSIFKKTFWKPMRKFKYFLLDLLNKRKF